MPNPYHAKNGRFTTKGSAAMTVGTVGKGSGLAKKAEKARSDKTRGGLDRFDKNGRSVFPGKPVYPDSPKIGVRTVRIDDVTQSGRSRKTAATPIRRGNSVSGYKMQDSLENGYGSGSKNAAGEQTRTKRMNTRTVRDRLNSLGSPPQSARPAKRSDNGASHGWGSGLVPGKKSDLGLRKPGNDSQFNRSIREANREANKTSWRKVNNDGYPAGASGGNMTRSESNKYHAEMARKDGRSGAPGGGVSRRGPAANLTTAAKSVENARSRKTAVGLDRLNSSGKQTFGAKDGAIRVRTARTDQIIHDTRPGLQPGQKRKNVVRGYKAQEALQNAGGSLNAAGQPIRTKRTKNKVVRNRSTKF